MNDVIIGDKTIKISEENNATLIDGVFSNYEIVELSKSTFKVFGEQTIFNVEVIQKEGKDLILKVNNQVLHLSISDHIDQILEKLGMDTVQSNAVKEIKAPMPGSILDIVVGEGDVVNANDQLLILEAMKMENVIKSPGDGIISRIHVSPEQNVEKNQVLISFE